MEHLFSLLVPFIKTFKLILYKKINVYFAFELEPVPCSTQNFVEDLVLFIISFLGTLHSVSVTLIGKNTGGLWWLSELLHLATSAWQCLLWKDLAFQNQRAKALIRLLLKSLFIFSIIVILVKPINWNFFPEAESRI